jgi:hypothetical protein
MNEVEIREALASGVAVAVDKNQLSQLISLHKIQQTEIAKLTIDLQTVSAQRDAALAALEDCQASYREADAAMVTAGLSKRPDTTDWLGEQARFLSALRARERAEGKVEALKSIQKWHIDNILNGWMYLSAEIDRRIEAARKEADRG